MSLFTFVGVASSHAGVIGMVYVNGTGGQPALLLAVAAGFVVYPLAQRLAGGPSVDPRGLLRDAARFVAQVRRAIGAASDDKLDHVEPEAEPAREAPAAERPAERPAERGEPRPEQAERTSTRLPEPRVRVRDRGKHKGRR